MVPNASTIIGTILNFIFHIFVSFQCPGIFENSHSSSWSLCGLLVQLCKWPRKFFLYDYQIQSSSLDAVVSLSFRNPGYFGIFIFHNSLWLMMISFVFINEPRSFAIFLCMLFITVLGLLFYFLGISLLHLLIIWFAVSSPSLKSQYLMIYRFYQLFLWYDLSWYNSSGLQW